MGHVCMPRSLPQVSLLLVSGSFGWPAEIANRLRKDLSILSLMMPTKSPELFSLIYALTIAVIWLSVADAVYVGLSFQRRAHKRIWPIVLLKVRSDCDVVYWAPCIEACGVVCVCAYTW